VAPTAYTCVLGECLSVTAIHPHILTLPSDSLRTRSPRSNAVSQSACSINALRVEKRLSFVRDSAYLPLNNTLASSTNRSCDDTVSSDNRDAIDYPAHEAPWILRDGNDLCDCDVFCAPSQGAVAYTPLAALKDLFRIAWSAMDSLSTPSSYPVLQVTHPGPFRSAVIDLGALELAAPFFPPDELFQVLPALPDRCRTSEEQFSTSSSLSRARYDGRMSTKSANQLDISSFNASACSSHGPGSTNSPHPHAQRTRKPSTLNAWMRWARRAKRKLLSAARSAQWLRSAERMERLGFETCGLFASARRRMVGVDMSACWDRGDGLLDYSREAGVYLALDLGRLFALALEVTQT
jgi:hypothetical protein